MYRRNNNGPRVCVSVCAGITLLNSKHSQITRNQEGNQVNIPTIRTKTSGANSIKSKSVNIWNDLSLRNILLIKKLL